MRAVLLGLTAVQTQAKPAGHPGKWSIQQIVEHLLQTYSTSSFVIRTRLEKGYPTRALPLLQQRAAQFVLITLGYFPRGRQAPAAVSPPASSTALDGNHLLAKAHSRLAQLDDVTAEGERLFGNVRAATHMILGPLSMQQWRRFHLVHGRHHLKQVQTIGRDQSL